MKYETIDGVCHTEYILEYRNEYQELTLSNIRTGEVGKFQSRFHFDVGDIVNMFQYEINFWSHNKSVSKDEYDLAIIKK